MTTANPWGHIGLWDPSCMLCGLNPGQRDPYVPDPEEMDPMKWRAILDAEGELICLVPLSGPDDQENWPELLAQFLEWASEKSQEPR